MTFAAVSDAGPIIHLSEIASLELLTVFDELQIPETVHAEVESGGIPDGLPDISYQLVEAETSNEPQCDLDPGERAALAVAEKQDSVLLTDDLAAREAATTVDIEVHGSIGVIALGYANGLIDKKEATASMHALQRETSLFVTDAVVERGVELLEGH
ncbi:MAG: nucleic acid-binding protein [Halopenitus sp.]